MPIIPFIFHSQRMQRRSANLILNLLNLMVDARIPDLSVKQDADVTLGKVQEKFRLDLSEEQAEVRSTPSLSLSVSLCLSLWLSGSLRLCLFYPTHISTEAYIMSILFTPAHPPLPRTPSSVPFRPHHLYPLPCPPFPVSYSFHRRPICAMSWIVRSRPLVRYLTTSYINLR